jgi:hypothetical protein
MKHEHKRRRAISSNQQKVHDTLMGKTLDEDDSTMMNREGGPGGNPGGDDTDTDS